MGCEETACCREDVISSTLLPSAVALAQLVLLALSSHALQSLFSLLSSFFVWSSPTNPTISIKVVTVFRGLKPGEPTHCLARCCTQAPPSLRVE